MFHEQRYCKFKSRMSNPETQLYKDLIDTIRAQCVLAHYSCHIVRIESNLTNQGIPDINGCINGKEFWIECKWNSRLLPLQIGWREQRRKAGGKVFCVNSVEMYYKLYWHNNERICNNIESIASQIITEVLK